MIWKAALSFQRSFLVICAVLLTLIVFTQVVMRYVFQTAIFGLEETAVYIGVWFYFIGGSMGASERAHISASLTDILVKNETIQHAIKTFSSLLTSVICGWMVVWSWELTVWSLKMGMMSTELGIHIGYIHLAMPVGLALMTVYFIAEFVDHSVELLRRLRS
jgi:TRAP-type C4-dicarboxylate transport system permease small subunit